MGCTICDVIWSCMLWYMGKVYNVESFKTQEVQLRRVRAASLSSLVCVESFNTYLCTEYYLIQSVPLYWIMSVYDVFHCLGQVCFSDQTEVMQLYGPRMMGLFMCRQTIMLSSWGFPAINERINLIWDTENQLYERCKDGGMTQGDCLANFKDIQF